MPFLDDSPPLSCPACDYALQGLVSRYGRVRCPECGARTDLQKLAGVQLRTRSSERERLHRFMLLMGFALVLLASGGFHDTERITAWWRMSLGTSPRMLAGIAMLLAVPLALLAAWLAPNRSLVLRLFFAVTGAGLLIALAPPYGLVGVVVWGFVILREPPVRAGDGFGWTPADHDERT